MKRSLWLLVIFLSCPAGASAPAGSYFGYQQLEQKVFSRIIKPAAKPVWSLSYFLTGIAKTGHRVEGLDRLLGFYEDGQFQNGSPNSLNWTLAHLVFSKLSEAMADTCVPWSRYRQYFQHRALQTLSAICSMSENGGWIEEEALLDFWVLLMGYDARFTEFDEWLHYANSESMRALPAQKRLSSLANTIFLNPFFLIRN